MPNEKRDGSSFRRSFVARVFCRVTIWFKVSFLSFSVASYNVLASAYIQRAWYRRAPALVLDPAWRVPALIQHIFKLDADILSLQEVEPETFVALRTSLDERGYGAQYARKSAGRPEGCAILYRREAFELISVRAIAYVDGAGGAPDTGYIALVALLRSGDGVLGVINTHLTWDPPNPPRAAQRGLRQAQQLAAEYENSAAQTRGWIIGGNFNSTPSSEVVAVMARAGSSRRTAPSPTSLLVIGERARG